MEVVSDRLSSACALRWQRSECNWCAIMGGIRFETNVGSLGEMEKVGVDEEGRPKEKKGKSWLGAMIGEEFPGRGSGEKRATASCGLKVD